MPIISRQRINQLIIAEHDLMMILDIIKEKAKRGLGLSGGEMQLLYSLYFEKKEREDKQNGSK